MPCKQPAQGRGLVLGAEAPDRSLSRSSCATGPLGRPMVTRPAHAIAGRDGPEPGCTISRTIQRKAVGVPSQSRTTAAVIEA